MTKLFAQPYDITACGFYFESFEEFQQKAAKAVNRYGEPVEEFEIQFIDGEDLDCTLAGAWNLSQATIKSYFEAVEDWDDTEKIKAIIALDDLGLTLDHVADDPDRLDIQISHIKDMRGLAIEVVDEGLLGRIPEHLKTYIDYDAIARDLEMDYTETVIAGETYIYRAD
ncbi:antirestriction protein ArdA [Roseibium alexandrii]|uniref:antirestriction protein ArdA n=1 Tax=Roseibium alexandrii TaxID=388408 RepID=UPI0037518E86